MTAAYGLFNIIAKWRHRSDDGFLSMGLEHVVLILQLFMLRKNGEAVLLTIKIYDDILLTGTNDTLRYFVHRFGVQFPPSEVLYGSGVLRFYGINVNQKGDYSVLIQAYDMLNAIEPYPLSRTGRHQVHDIVRKVESRAFMSIIASIG